MEYKFTITENDTNLIINALADLPYKVSKGLIDNLISQAQGQIKPPETSEAKNV